jgi:putative phosphoribosyl transferase
VWAVLNRPVHGFFEKRFAMLRYRNRTEAGKVLAAELSAYKDRADVIVLALPRGGVPVAFEVAAALAAPLDVFLVRKLGTPGQSELAMGAIASGGIRVLNSSVIEYLGIPDQVIDAVSAREQEELVRREREYRYDLPPIDVRGRTVILIDDGLATGSTMKAAIVALRQREPARIVVAVPVAPRSTCDELREEVDELVCPQSPDHFDGVGRWYDDFSQTTDGQVRELLDQSRLQFAGLDCSG